VRAHFFSVHVVDTWNTIPADIKRVKKPEEFKKQYRKLRARYPGDDVS